MYPTFKETVKTPNVECLVEVYKCPKDLWAQYVENLYVLKEGENNEVALQQLPAIQKPVLFCKIKPPANLLKTTSKARKGEAMFILICLLTFLLGFLIDSSGELPEFESFAQVVGSNTSRSDRYGY